MPQLQTFTWSHNAPVGTLVLMHDHVLGSFHHDGQQFDLTQIEGDVYGVLDFNKRTNLAPFACGVDEAPSRKRSSARKRAPTAPTTVDVWKWPST